MKTQHDHASLAHLTAFLLAGGILVGARHCNTRPAPEGGTDKNCLPSDKGRAQARRMRDALHERYGGDIRMVIASTAERALYTVHDRRWPDPTVLEELYLTPRTTQKLIEEANVLDDAFDHLKHSPLRTYRAEEKVGKMLDRWRDRALEAVNGVFHAMPLTSGTVVIGGHAIMTNELVAALAQIIDADADVSVALDTPLGECDVLELTVGTDRKPQIRHFPLPKNEPVDA